MKKSVPKDRKHPRTAVVVTVDWQVEGSGDNFWSATDDVSEGGLRVKTLTPPEVGTPVLVRLGLDQLRLDQLKQAAADAGGHRVPARVAWVRMDDEVYGMGLCFEPEDAVDEEKLARLLQTARSRGTRRVG